MWVKVNVAAVKAEVPVDSIYRYVRKGMKKKYNDNNELLVNPDLVLKFRAKTKPTGRPRKPKREFKFDWETFYKKAIEKHGKIGVWIENNKFKRSRFYLIKSGDLYPSREEEKKLKKM